jgi:hypothetical protein
MIHMGVRLWPLALIVCLQRDCGAPSFLKINLYPSVLVSSMAQRTSLALFLATASMIGGSAAPVDAASLIPFSAEEAQLLADSAECVPNCEREKLNQKTKESVVNPAANDSIPASNPGADGGSAEDTLNLIERGDL